MAEIKLHVPNKDQLMWPMLIVSLVMGGGSGVGLIERWHQYQVEQDAYKEEVFAAKGALSARIAENARQNGTEWKVFSRKINHLEERVVFLEGKLNIVHPHVHPPTSHNTSGPIVAVYHSTEECPRCTHSLQWVLDLDEVVGGESIMLKCPMCMRVWRYYHVIAVNGRILQLKAHVYDPVTGVCPPPSPGRRQRRSPSLRSFVEVGATKQPL